MKLMVIGRYQNLGRVQAALGPEWKVVYWLGPVMGLRVDTIVFGDWEWDRANNIYEQLTRWVEDTKRRLMPDCEGNIIHL